MTWLKRIVALGVIAASLAVVARVLFPRYVCNRDKELVNTRTFDLERSSGDAERKAGARELVAMCTRCLEQFPNDYEFHLLRASNLEMLGDLQGAEAGYRRSLELNERPETYGYLALCELQQGKIEDARKHLLRGGLFNLSVVELVSDPWRTETLEAVLKRHRELGNGSSREAFDRWRERRRLRMLREQSRSRAKE
jgi:tetratricopeptide (TPR) repeat protein